MLYFSINEKYSLITSWAVAQEGNYVESNYYTAVEPGNPSGNKNLKELKFYTKDNELKYHILYEYDTDDDIIKQTGLI